MIDFLIEHDEGGWLLTSNKDDPDGGWTYAGITKSKFVEFSPGWQSVTFNDMKNNLKHSDKLKLLTDIVYKIYYKEYFDKLKLNEFNSNWCDALFSCGVNCGVDTAAKILQQTVNKLADQPLLVCDGIIGPKTFSYVIASKSYNSDNKWRDAFLAEWHRHYINIVQANSRAWRDWATLLYAAYLNPTSENIRAIEQVEKPRILRATQLEGWFNRVERYRK
jgi:lysozyme family protein